MDELTPRPTRSRGARFFGHTLAAVWIVLVLSVHLARHRDVAELRTAAREGTVSKRLDALQQLAMRADPATLAAEFPASLLASDEPLLRELAFTNLFNRPPATQLRARDLQRLTDPAERRRARLWLQCRMTTPGRVQLSMLDQWFAEADPGGNE